MGTLGKNEDISSENARVAAEKAHEATKLAWLALTLSPGLGPKRITDAMRRVDDELAGLEPVSGCVGLLLRGDRCHYALNSLVVPPASCRREPMGPA